MKVRIPVTPGTVSFTDLDQRIELIIFESILNPFVKQAPFYWGSRGSIENWLKLKIEQIGKFSFL
jgi:hypothetical protein